MSEPLVWCNDRFQPLCAAGLRWYDAGFVYGAVLVDNARTFHRRLFLWPHHLERLRRHCRLAGFDLSYTDAQLTAAAEALVEHNGRLLPPHEELQLVTFVTPGPLGLYLGHHNNGPPTVGMMTYPLPRRRYRCLFTEGVDLEIVGCQHTDAGDLLPPAFKHRSRLVWYLAEQRKRNPAAVPVVINQHGVGDTPIASVVAVAAGQLLLPPPEQVLESVSMQFLQQLCGQVGIPQRQECVDLRRVAALEAAEQIDELLLVGTAFCIAGVRRLVVGERQRQFPWPGLFYQRLLSAWEEAVGAPIACFFTR